MPPHSYKRFRSKPCPQTKHKNKQHTPQGLETTTLKQNHFYLLKAIRSPTYRKKKNNTKREEKKQHEQCK